MAAKQTFLFLVTAAMASILPVYAADTTAPSAPADAAPEASPVAAELEALVQRIQAKLQTGIATEGGFSGELAEFDALLTKHADQDSEDLAQVLLLKAMLYVQVFEDLATGETLLQQIVADYPKTEVAANVPQMLATVRAVKEATAVLAALTGRPAPELNFEWASRPDLKTLSGLKGKVVVLDFWATWCGPCIRSFPEVRELTAHYAGHDVEVVGVTSLQGKVHGLSSQPIDCEGNPAKEHELMTQFIEKMNITWTVAFSAEPVYNPAWGVRGIPYLAIVAPDGTVRHAGLHPASPLTEKTAKIDALLDEFGLSKPAAR